MAEGGFDAGSVVGRLELSLKKWDQSVEKIKSDQQSMQGFALRHSQEIKKLGDNLTRYVTVPLAAMAAGSVKAFADFDKAMTESKAIMGNLSSDMEKKLSATAKQMATETTFSAKSLAQAYYYLASAGLDANDSIGALPVVAKFAQAGAFDLEKATEMLADAQSAMGMRSKDAAQNIANLTRVSDVLVDAANASNASVSQFGEALTNKAGTALRTVNKGLEEGVAVLAAYADQGIKGSMAGDALNIMMRDLQGSAIDNADAWRDAGIAVYDANGKMNNMADIIAGLERHLGPLSDEERKVALSTLGLQERSQAYTLALVGMSDKIREYETRLRSAGGVTDDIANKQLKSFSAQMDIAKNRAVNAAIGIGEKLAPVLVALAGTLNGIVSGFSALPGPVQNLIIGIGALAAGLGPMLRLWGSWLEHAGKLKAALPGIGQVIKEKMTAEITGLGGALKNIPAVAAAAFVGWNIGKLIGDLTGLNAAVLKLRRGITDEMATTTSAQQELRNMLEGTGLTVNSLRAKYGSFQAALQNVRGMTVAEAAALKASMDAQRLATIERTKAEAALWIEEKGLKGVYNFLVKVADYHPKVATGIRSLAEAAKNTDALNSLQETLNLTFRGDVLAEIDSITKALKANSEARAAGQKVTVLTAKSEQELRNRLRELQAELAGATDKAKSLKDELGITFSSDIEAKIKAIDRALQFYKANLTPGEVTRLREEQDKLKASLSESQLVVQSMPKNLHTFDSALKSCAGASDEAAAQTERFGRVLDRMKQHGTSFKAAAKAIRKDMEDTKEAFEAGEISVEEYEAEMKRLEKTLRDVGNNTKKSWTSSFQGILQVAESVFNSITSIVSLSYQNQTAEQEKWYTGQTETLDEWYEREKAAIENSLASEEEKAAARAALDAQYQEKKKALDDEYAAKQKQTAHDQAVTNKAISLVGAIINTAQGVTAALASAPPPWNLILAGITAAAGAVQVALISSQPIPAAEGLILQKPTLSRDGGFLGGEAGTEVVFPLDRVGEVMVPALAAAGVGSAAGDCSFVFNFSGPISSDMDLRQIGRALGRQVRNAISGSRR